MNFVDCVDSDSNMKMRLFYRPMASDIITPWGNSSITSI